METNSESIWLQSVVNCDDGYETAAVERFTVRLIQLARTRLPERLRRRVDPEDIVQSVFHSFFRRNGKGQFQLENSGELWRLLAAITYHKVMSAIEFHGRQKRDYGRDVENNAKDSVADLVQGQSDEAASVSAIAIMTELLDQILDSVPEVHKQILLLRLENHSIDEIATQLGISSRTVDRALKRARLTAEELMTQDNNENRSPQE